MPDSEPAYSLSAELRYSVASVYSSTGANDVWNDAP